MHYHFGIAGIWIAAGLVAIKGQVGLQNYYWSYYHYAAGFAAIGFRVLFAHGIQPAAWSGEMAVANVQ